MSRELVDKLKEAVAAGDQDEAQKLAQSIAKSDANIMKVVEELSATMRDVGEKFERLEVFLSDLMLSAEAMRSAMSVFQPILTKARVAGGQRAAILIGTVQGDIHDIGKNIVSALFTAAAFEVTDIGVDVPAGKFAEKGQEIRSDIIASSALMTTTIPCQEDIIKQLDSLGVRRSFKVLVGGGAVTKKDADRMGADGFAPDAMKGVDEVKRLLATK